MKVRIFATLRSLVGAKELEVDVQAGDTVRHVLEKLTTEYPALAEYIWDSEGHLRRTLSIFIRGRSIRFKDGLDTVLEPGDDLALFPPVAGG